MTSMHKRGREWQVAVWPLALLIAGGLACGEDETPTGGAGDGGGGGAEIDTTVLALRINELMADNQAWIPDENGEYDDWIELYNPTGEAIKVGGLGLTDDPDRPDQWVLPDTTITAAGFLLVWADEESEQGVMHAPFGLDKDDGDQVLFYSLTPVQVLIDSVSFGPQDPDVSLARAVDGSGAWVVDATPTPAATNAR